MLYHVYHRRKKGSIEAVPIKTELISRRLVERKRSRREITQEAGKQSAHMISQAEQG